MNEYGGNPYGTGSEPVQVQTKTETDRKCPACGGTMDFDPGTGGLLCPYCGHAEAIEPAGGQAPGAEELRLETAEQTGNRNWGAEKKKVSCKSCGAESIYDALQVAGECPYCGSNQVMEASAEDTLAPGGVCPFQVDAKTAGQRFKEWIKRKIFCPRKAKQMAEPEKFTGVYLPFWTFDAQTTSHFSGQYGIHRTVRDRDGKTRTVTDWYPVSGVHQEFIDDHLERGTTRHDEGHLRQLEPYNTAANVAYKPEYVAGFAAERYSIGIKAAWEKAKQAIFQFLNGQVQEKVRRERRADTVRIDHLNVDFSAITYKYLLLPVWISSFTYKDKVYQFLVNGQTGKVGGKTPISPLRVAIAVVLGLAAAALLLWFISET